MEQQIKEIIQEVLCLDQAGVDSIQNDQALFDYGLDSLKAIEMIVLIEEKFDVSVDDEDLLIDNMESVEKISELIKKYNGNE